MKSQKKVVIVGAGFGGLNAAKALADSSEFDILLIDKTNYHLFQPLLYQVATAALSPGDIAMPIREIFRNNQNIKIIMSAVNKINRQEKQIILEDAQIIAYDFLILSPGSRHAYFGKPEWEKFAPGLKNLDDALHIREAILTSFELAEKQHDQHIIDSLLTFVVIGAGPTGVEMAGAISEIAHQSLKKNFRAIDPSRTKVYLIEGSHQILNGYPQKLANYAQRDLEKKRVTVLLNTRVDDVLQEGVRIGEKFIRAHNIIWAAGNIASPLLQTLNATYDKQGRVVVESDLSLKGDPSIFVIGDACCYHEKGKILPAIAPVAVQQGRFVGKLIRKKSDSRSRPAFRYIDRGMMANIGKFDALVLSGPLQSTGLFAWFAWCFVHIYFLIGFRTKLFVFIQWVFYFFRGQRNVRLIETPIDTKKPD